MLQEMPPEKLDEWMAADEIEQLLGHGKLYQMLALIGSCLVNSWGGKSEPKNFIPKSPADYRLEKSDKGNTEAATASPNQAAALFAQSAHRLGLSPLPVD